jgi:hypothetical protein
MGEVPVHWLIPSAAFMFAFDIGSAIDAIHGRPSSPLRSPQ